MKFDIPESFQIAGLTIKVEPSTEILIDGCFGKAHYTEQKIRLAVNDHLTEDMIKSTFFHELTHFIHESMGLPENHPACNEQYVDAFSRLLYQCIKTME